MSAPSLYRRHRPRTFDDVVGQDHVVRTLRNAVEQGKVHHAYLFVGSRGTGKTSLSKILAACLDCENGPTITPCGTCDSCLSIQRATSLDVVEMDAASNNSVDDVRELRERVATAPSTGRWRVYILDEAHMLTTQAWNALLKTLEEPPPQTVFVLATTEAHKVPATVVDRCHRFDFTRPTGEQISRVLARVVEREGLTMTDAAVALVARHANGSFRDALGTLEQLVTYAGNTVTEQDAVTVLGIGDDAQIFAAVDAVISGSAPDALRVVQDVASHGRDLGSYARELERHARDLLVCCILGGVPPEVRLTADRDALLDGQARRIGRDQATRLLELLAEALTAARAGADQRAMLELALVKAADPNVDPALRALQARLSRLEEQSGGGAPAAPAAVPAPVEAVAPEPVAIDPAPVAPVVDAGAAFEQPAEPDVPPFIAPQLRQVPEPAGGAPDVAFAPATDAHATPSPVAPEPHVASAPATDANATSEPAPQPAAATQPEPALQAVPTPAGLSIEGFLPMWPAVLENLAGRDHLCAVALERSQPVGIEGAELTIAFPTDAAFYRGTADREERRLALREALREVTGVPLTIRFELRDLTAPAPPIADAEPPAPADIVAAPPSRAPLAHVTPSPDYVPPAPPPADPDSYGAPAAMPPTSPEPYGAPAVAPSAPTAAPTPPPASVPTPQPVSLGRSPEALDEHSIVAHLVTEFDAEDIGAPTSDQQEPR